MEGAKILVVDDDAFIRRPLEFLLGQEGFAASSAVDGEACLERLAAERPDLIILDVMMPGKSGFEVCEIIKADPDLAVIPVILLSARAQDEDRRRGLDAGAEDYIVKPYAPAELLGKVRELVGQTAAG